MEGTITGGQTQGKLNCPQCSARLGAFNWSGMQNTAGAWVTPAFQLHLKSVDVIEPRPSISIRAGRVSTLPAPAAAAAAARRFTHVIFDCE